MEVKIKTQKIRRLHKVCQSKNLKLALLQLESKSWRFDDDYINCLNKGEHIKEKRSTRTLGDLFLDLDSENKEKTIRYFGLPHDVGDYLRWCYSKLNFYDTQEMKFGSYCFSVFYERYKAEKETLTQNVNEKY